MKSELENLSSQQPMYSYGCASDCAVIKPHPRHQLFSLPHASVNLTKKEMVKSADIAGIGTLINELLAAENSNASGAGLNVV